MLFHRNMHIIELFTSNDAILLSSLNNTYLSMSGLLTQSITNWTPSLMAPGTYFPDTLWLYSGDPCELVS